MQVSFLRVQYDSVTGAYMTRITTLRYQRLRTSQHNHDELHSDAPTASHEGGCLLHI